MNRGRESVSFDEVIKTVKKHVKDMNIDHITMLGEGWRSRAYLINHQFVFRFPKDKDGAMDTEKEIETLPSLRKHICLSTPEFIYYGKQENGYPFVGYKILPGEPLDESLFNSLSAETKEIIANQVATFMDQINSFSIKEAKSLKVPEPSFRQIYLEKYAELKEKAFFKMDQDMQNYLSFRFESYLENKEYFSYAPKLIHADLSLDHLLFDHERQELSGIIDFGDMKMGDPDYEYLYLLEECGEAFTIKIMNIREEQNIPFKLEKLSFFLIADHAFFLLEGLKRRDQTMVEEALGIIQSVMERDRRHY